MARARPAGPHNNAGWRPSEAIRRSPIGHSAAADLVYVFWTVQALEPGLHKIDFTERRGVRDMAVQDHGAMASQGQKSPIEMIGGSWRLA